MKNKVIISIVAALILIAALLSVISFNNKLKQNNGGGQQIYKSFEEAEKNAAFDMKYPDRLGGFPVEGFVSNSSMIEVRYESGGFIRKTLGVTDNSGDTTEYTETTEHIVNGVSVTFKGDDGLVRLAVWNYNNFAYTVSVSRGVAAEEMTEYIEATR